MAKETARSWGEDRAGQGWSPRYEWQGWTKDREAESRVQSQDPPCAHRQDATFPISALIRRGKKAILIVTDGMERPQACTRRFQASKSPVQHPSKESQTKNDL